MTVSTDQRGVGDRKLMTEWSQIKFEITVCLSWWLHRLISEKRPQVRRIKQQSVHIHPMQHFLLRLKTNRTQPDAIHIALVFKTWTFFENSRNRNKVMIYAVLSLHKTQQKHLSDYWKTLFLFMCNLYVITIEMSIGINVNINMGIWIGALNLYFCNWTCKSSWTWLLISRTLIFVLFCI